MLYQGDNVQLHVTSDHIAELSLNAAKSAVNKFDRQTISEFTKALDMLSSEVGIKGLLIFSQKPAFLVGADITEFGSVFEQGKQAIIDYLSLNNNNFNRLESLDFPVVVAINGYALGGGCELALAADYRIGSNDCRIGLPETRLGIMPGWGGTVRLPRLVGIETAVEWIAGAKEYKAEDALKAGVLDGVVAPDVLKSSALTTLNECINGHLDYAYRREQKAQPLQHSDIESTLAFTTSKAFVKSQAGPHYPAPVAAVDVIRDCSEYERDQALAIESERFASLASTSVAQALVGLFIGDQLLSKKAKLAAKSAPFNIERAGVIGAGIMGGGIAYQSAYKGTPVLMKDIEQSGLDLGISEAKSLLTKRVDRGRLSVEKMADILSSITPTLHFNGFDQLNVVVEAVVEHPGVKAKVLAEVEGHMHSEGVLASNTSTISITELAKNLKRPEQFCGMHFFNPVHAMPLVEVIRGEKTSDSTIAAVVAYAAAMGKKAIVVNDCPGFLVNRVLFPYFSGFMQLIDDGADIEQIDQVMHRWGWPMGPAHLLDVIGLDTAVHAQSVMAKAYPDRFSDSTQRVIHRLVAVDRLGQKRQHGFYRYEKDKKGRWQKANIDYSDSVLSKPSIELTDDTIIERMMVPMITELARCVEENIVESVAEADLALIYGLGFPPFRGGVFRWLDTLGTEVLSAMLERHQSLGGLYIPPPSLKEAIANHQPFYQP